MNIQRFEKLEEILCSGIYYICSDTGRVWSNKRKGQWLKSFLNKKGYHQVELQFGGKGHQYSVHELVAFEMFGRELVGMTVNHLNGLKDSNACWNIELATNDEQQKHAWGTGLKVAKTGETHGMSKLDNSKVLEIRSLYDSGIYTQRQLAKKFDVKQSTIWNILNGRTWKGVGV